MSAASINNQLVVSDFTLPIGSLEAYIHRVQSILLLTESEEKDLTERLYYKQDVSAARRLVMSHLRFVVSIARKYSGYGLAQADLIQEGNIGLMKAVKRFNPEKGVRLVSFAVHWVKAEIHEFIIKNWKIVKVATTKSQRKLFFNLRRMLTKHVGWMDAAKAKEISKTLDVSEKDVFLMESRLTSSDDPLDVVGSEQGGFILDDDGQANPAFVLEEEESSECLKQNLKKALDVLDPRSYDIVYRRWLLPKDQRPTLSDLAKEYSISLERVRQVEKAAMNKVKQAVLSLLPEDQNPI